MMTLQLDSGLAELWLGGSFGIIIGSGWGKS